MTQDSVKKWLIAHGRSRKWLAEKCEVAPQTVNNWLSTARGIPAKAEIIISTLMAADDERGRREGSVPQNLILYFTRSQFDLIQDCALAEGKRVNEWAQCELLKLAEEDIDAVDDRLKVAEPVKNYRTSKKPKQS